MIRRPPRSTLSSSSAASDVYKRQPEPDRVTSIKEAPDGTWDVQTRDAVSYTHLRAHETPEHLVCRLLLARLLSISYAVFCLKRLLSNPFAVFSLTRLL